ncbi:MAG: HPr family phosphocarrier protein [Rhodospirillales bacterium]
MTAAGDPASAAPPTGPIRRRATVVNQRGLHARPAAKFAKLAQGFDADVRVAAKGENVSALSIMGLMMLGAGPGTELEITATGNDAAAAAAALAAFIDNSFDES